MIDGAISVDDAKTAINTAVDAGTDAIANDSTNNISSADKTLMTGTPFSPNWGPLSNYEVNGLEDVFPFCIPFDVARCIALLCAEPEAPRIEYPFRIERWGIDETIVLDMARFESVAAVSRWCETLGFIFFLVTKTRALMFS